MRKVFDDPSVFDEDDMPCRCDCGNWFDLLDGCRSTNKPGIVICQECRDLEEYEENMRMAEKELNEIDDYEENWEEEDDEII